MLLILLSSFALAGVPTKLESDKDRGEMLYMRNCWQCHGKQGLGDGPLAEAFDPLTPLAGTIPPEDYDVTIALIRQGRGSMPAFSDVIDKHDARRVLVWLAKADQPDEEPTEDEDEASKDEAADEAASQDAAPEGDGAEPGPGGAEGGG